MEELLHDIIERVRKDGDLPPAELSRIIDRANARVGGPERAFSKKRLLPFYFRMKREDTPRWESWQVDEGLERRLVRILRMKPRRSASGVATITVITKPHACSHDCIYCPSDARMPKSYLHDEPACQRAERNYFDPYLQVCSRLRALEEMGHCCDKVELIVLGGTWSDYPPEYRLWFCSELFRALVEGCYDDAAIAQRRKVYEEAGISWQDAPLAKRVAAWQERLDRGEAGHAEACAELYGSASAWGPLSAWQRGSQAELERWQLENEGCAHRCVGLVVETRPENITPGNLVAIRKLGCTKVQVGVQSLRENVLAMNGRPMGVGTVERAFALLRIFGFKIHAHFMANLLGSTPEEDVEDYRRLVTDGRFSPDEVKLYPCALIDGTALTRIYRQGAYRPYGDEELMGVLAADMLATPPWTRVSRMIRDFSSDDIVAGNKRPNLRQMVDGRLASSGEKAVEIRSRELALGDVRMDELKLKEEAYETPASHERFLQYVAANGTIAAFLRLSVPKREAVEALGGKAPVGLGEAMIREVHVYGKVAGIHASGDAAQHRGLGKRLIARAERIAEGCGCTRINVISAVGTREYYRKLGFGERGLYQSKEL